MNMMINFLEQVAGEARKLYYMSLNIPLWKLVCALGVW